MGGVRFNSELLRAVLHIAQRAHWQGSGMQTAAIHPSSQGCS